MESRLLGSPRNLGIPQAEARAYIDRYFARYEGVKAFIEKTLEDTRRGGAVRTMFGRVRPIPDISSRNPMRVDSPNAPLSILRCRERPQT